MGNYQQLPAKMHLISRRLASCSLTTWSHGLFSTDISPVRLLSRSQVSHLLISRLLSRFLSLSLSLLSTCGHIQRIQELVFFKILVCFSFPAENTRVASTGLN